jgi:membrane-bound ClpP family serine protease
MLIAIVAVVFGVISGAWELHGAGGAAFIVLMVVHLALHGRQISAMAKSYFAKTADKGNEIK